jgi:hypothetical protein
MTRPAIFVARPFSDAILASTFSPSSRFVAGSLIMLKRTVLIALLYLVASSVANATLTHTTFNFDFGNGPTYSGPGLLPGAGNYWNKISVSAPSSPGGLLQLNVPSLLDSYGNSLGKLFDPVNGSFLHAPDLIHTLEGSANTAIAEGPLSDGMTLTPGSGVLWPGGSVMGLRELTHHTPVDIIICFNSPSGGSGINTITISPSYNPVASYTATDPTGLFLGGQPARDYIAVSNVPLFATTIGDPEWPGIIIGVPTGSVANIAAMQISGTFRHVVPEPASAVLLLFCSAGFFFRHALS